MNLPRVCVLLACLLAPGHVQADLIGIQLRTDPLWDDAASALLTADAHVVRLYAVFDGPAGPNNENVVLAAFDSTLSVADAAAAFYQTPAPPGSDTAPSSDLFATYPALEWDTFVSVGVLDSLSGDTTAVFPDFVMGINTITGGWYNSYPPNHQGAPDQDFAVVLVQLTILGLPPDVDAAAEPDLLVHNPVLDGTLTVSHNSANGPINTEVTFTTLVDCNGNGIDDQIDIDEGTSEDSNRNDVPDECDDCICGDLDLNGRVNLNDAVTFFGCYWLPEPDPNCSAWQLECSDLDQDGNVSLSDYATFAVIYGKEMTLSPPQCLDGARSPVQSPEPTRLPPFFSEEP
ncbi:MAG: hypothetical protein JSU68_14405 [Phycisphaerales bacterium]|nr:MAG: hypothetical protein JSU68_14405 [Phycisphaerales bacterium]